MHMAKLIPRIALVAALVPTAALAALSALSGPASATPVEPRLPAFAATTFTVNGGQLAAEISDDTTSDAVIGLVQPATNAATYISLQACDSNEANCANISNTARSYSAGSAASTPMTGPATPAAGTTYRTCAIVNVSGSIGGACSPVVFQGGRAFLSTVNLAPAPGRLSSVVTTQALNGQMESLQSTVWICNGYGANCSVVAKRQITSYLAPQHGTWSAALPSVMTSFGHTYKGCATMSVQGASASACTPFFSA